MTQAISVFIRVPVQVKSKRHQHIAECLPLRIVSQGSSVEQARDRLREELQLFIMAAISMGTLDKVMADCGFVHENKPDLGSGIRIEMAGSDTMDIPVPPTFIAATHVSSGAD